MQAEGPKAVRALGITVSAERVYRAILGFPDTSATVLADRIGMPLADVQRDVAALVENRLVTMHADRFQARPPQLAFGPLLAREARQLMAAEEALARARIDVFRYEVEHQAGLLPGGQSLVAEVVEPAETRTVANSLALSTDGEMLFLRPDNWQFPESDTTDVVVTEALLGGRTSRVLYPAEYAERRGQRQLDRVAAGERVRVLPHVPCRMAVFGTQAALVPQTWDGIAVTAVVVRQPGIVSVCRAWFEELWSHGVEIVADQERHESREDERARLLDLLARGVKDERIARTLGVSLRTVRRRIADVMAELGVTSRFQAGVEASRRGWLR
jgi:DNA-binding CsgD family transcriptional regulator/DNA-binding MarR family transcriptional regulator